MPQSPARVLVHTVFSTKGCSPFLRDRALRAQTHRQMCDILSTLECPPIIVGGAADHVHLLCAMSRTIAAAKLVKRAKRASALWIKSKGAAFSNFAWQSGYGMFSIDATQIAATRAHIANQEAHHRGISFQDEYRALLARYKVPYDERYIWD